ncbi:leucyl aminopeptidase [Candidatus Uhrbacteria bacterium]|nr:leucyl aminopeptidase [Candidatus Uhrbacteria bacterium]
MNFKSIKDNPLKIKADLLVVGVFAGPLDKNREIRNLDKLLGGALSDEANVSNFCGKNGETLMVGGSAALGAKRAVLLGLGELNNWNAEALRRAAGSLIKFLQNKKADTLAISSFGLSNSKLSLDEAIRAFTEGALLANYNFNKYKVKKTPKEKFDNAKTIIFVVEDAASIRSAQKAISEAELSAKAVFYSRDLVNEPASICVPFHLAGHAREVAKASKGAVAVKIFNREECRKRGMGAFLSVAAGAGEEPYFMHLIYKPRAASRRLKKIALVGKGITFDSGGLQIKPGESMATMKLDMAGAAAVLGVFSVIAEIAPRAEVHGIIAATENMPGPKAYKPGDICRASNGKTIEIGHTDAEGRVTLADALSYAAKLKPDAIIDLATLTGACMVALGEEVAGLMSNSKKLADKIKAAARISGERVWELPLIPEYKHLIKGTHGDVKNSGGSRYGGAITAGLFLEEFVGAASWAHLDIAGPAWAERETISYIPLGGTGFGSRTLIQILKNL